MNAVWVIFRRELAASLGQPGAWFGGVLYVAGVAFFGFGVDDLFAHGLLAMNGLFFWMAVGLVVYVPAVTMRLIAEERRSGSLEFVATLPLRPIEIVVGKWAAAVVTVGVTLGATLPWPIVLWWLGPLDVAPVVGGYLGLSLLAAAFAAMGVCASAVSETASVAFLLGFVACLFPWALGFALDKLPLDWVGVAQAGSFQAQLAGLSRGILDTRAVVLFLSVAALSLGWAAAALERRRLA